MSANALTGKKVLVGSAVSGLCVALLLVFNLAIFPIALADTPGNSGVQTYETPSEQLGPKEECVVKGPTAEQAVDVAVKGLAAEYGLDPSKISSYEAFLAYDDPATHESTWNVWLHVVFVDGKDGEIKEGTAVYHQFIMVVTVDPDAGIAEISQLSTLTPVNDLPVGFEFSAKDLDDCVQTMEQISPLDPEFASYACSLAGLSG
jgi:hypothetical protein